MPGVSDISFNKRYRVEYVQTHTQFIEYLRDDFRDVERMSEALSSLNNFRKELDRYKKIELKKFQKLLSFVSSYKGRDCFKLRDSSSVEGIDSTLGIDYYPIRNSLGIEALGLAFQVLTGISGRQNYLFTPAVNDCRKAFYEGIEGEGRPTQLLPFGVEATTSIWEAILENRRSIQWTTAKVDAIENIVDSISSKGEFPDKPNRLGMKLGMGTRAHELAQKIKGLQFSYIYKTIKREWDKNFKKKDRKLFPGRSNRSHSNINLSEARKRIQDILQEEKDGKIISEKDVGALNPRTIDEYILCYDEALMYKEKYQIDIEDLLETNGN